MCMQDSEMIKEKPLISMKNIDVRGLVPRQLLEICSGRMNL